MLEFFSIETLKAVVVLFIAASLLYVSISSNARAKKRKKIKRYFLLFALLCLTIPFIEANIAQADAKRNQTSFVNGARFICEGNKVKKYRVSKEDQWSIKGSYFFKDLTLIRADKCEVL